VSISHKQNTYHHNTNADKIQILGNNCNKTTFVTKLNSENAPYTSLRNAICSRLLFRESKEENILNYKLNFANTSTNIRIPEKAKKFLTIWAITTFSRKTLHQRVS